MRHQLAPRRSRQTLHFGNHRQRQILDRKHHARALRKQALVVSQFRLRVHLLEVVTGAKRFSDGRNHDGARRSILRNRVKRLLQSRKHVLAEHIEALGAVQLQGVNAARIVCMQHRRFRQ